jgi:hypothetical protein
MNELVSSEGKKLAGFVRNKLNILTEISIQISWWFAASRTSGTPV